MTVGIYQIKCLENNKVYIGCSKNIEHRWKQHKNSLKNNNHKNTHLQRSWDKYGEGVFIFSIIEECELDQLIEREQFYLDQIFEGGNTFNICKLSERVTGRILSDEHKRKIGEANKGKKRSQEQINKLIQSNKGRKHSEDLKIKRSNALKGHKGRSFTEDQKVSMSIKKTGFKHSDETKRKISEASKGRKHTEDTKRIIGDKNRKVPK